MSRGPTETILVVSHRTKERERLAGLLRRSGLNVRAGASAAEALESYAHDPAAVVVLDRGLPGRDGVTLTGLLRTEHADAVIVVVGARADVEETVALMKEGAFHVLPETDDPEQFLLVVEKALEHGRLSRGNRQLRNQLDISEKLAMIGRLASGVAHELNNPLDGVRRYVRMTQEGLQSEAADLSSYLERAMNGLSRMASIVRQLLTFSRNVVIENEGENLRAMLQEVVRTLTVSGEDGSTIDLENPYLDVLVPRALFQVFSNLIKNALHAVEELGERGLVRVSVAREGEAIEVRVSDNGTGIAPDDLLRVFEPFFTTKEVGKGTGLGLPISARGTIRIESEAGQGTTVYVTIPIGAAAAKTVSPFQEAQS